MAGRGRSEGKPFKGGKANPDVNESSLLTSMREMMDEMRTDILGKFESIVSESVKKEVAAALEPLETQLSSHGERISDIEHSANSQDEIIANLQATVGELTAAVDDLTKKCEDLESRSRWNNIRILGVPEGAEGTKPTAFTSEFLQEMLGLDEKPTVDRAHRSLREKPPKDQPPRPLVVRVHRFQVRNEILRRAAASSPLSFKEKRISIFPDFTPAVAKKRAEFATVKKILHSYPEVKFGLRYPATLRITPPGGETQSFTDAAQAARFVEKHIKKGGHTESSD